MRVFVYFNLHKKVWSIKDLATGRVVQHASQVLLTDCTFKVSKAGRERVLRERRKNVHAGVVGTLIAADPTDTLQFTAKYIPVTYNPYKYETFVNKLDSTPISKSDMVLMTATPMPTVLAAA
jgi:hypothetical protein